MNERELALTAYCNHHFAGVANMVLGWLRMPAQAQPWTDWLVVEFVVAALILILVAVARRGLSVDQPGKLQHTLELTYGFLSSQSDDVGVAHKNKYLPFFGTLFLFILVCNLVGLIPVFASPTMYPSVPLGLAVMTFFYYNWMGLREQGLFRYLGHFAGPVWWLAWLMFPIEIMTHLARMLSLTVRLFANMFAGEQVILAFMTMVPIAIPALFMGLHVFVALLQAYIWALLAMIYVSGAVAHEP
jgi:F-type H+-transporting ATPase subunit a